MSRKLSRQFNTRRLILLISLVFVTTASADAPSTAALLSQRLSYMQSVALYKWQHQRPIEDLEREEIVLNAAVEQGLNYGISAASGRRFFQIQIDAAKEIQAYWFAYWRAHPKQIPKEVADLNTTIRPRLIQLGNQILQSLASESRQANHRLSIEGLSNTTADLLIAGISTIERYPNRLAQIIDTGVLRVGTTGDYAPFSLTKGSSYQGIDIDLANDLAQSLDVELKWIETSWPTLMQDFSAGKFDIGMSGISINLKRQRHAFFSTPYHEGGKTPIVRCEDKQKFNTLADIDKKGVQVIVNPGGTNQGFVDANIVNAKVIIHDDNRTIFTTLIKLQADVMITDEIEVRLQAARHQSLCAAMPNNTLTFAQKGFLLPQDIIWKAYVDAWLNIRKGDASLDRIFSKHLN